MKAKKKQSRLGKEKIRSLKRARREKLRIVAKAVLYDQNGRVLCFTGSDDRGGASKPNFPGGGRNKGERLWKTLQRETFEETSLKMTSTEARNVIVLRRGKVTTSRPGFDYKYLVLGAHLCEDLAVIFARDEIANPTIFNSAAEAISWIQSSKVVLHSSVRKFYVSALKKLEKIIG